MQSVSRAPAAAPSGRLRGLVAAATRLPKVPTVIVVLVFLTSLSAGWLTSTILPEANQIDLRFRYTAPWPLEGSSPAHLLGTDRLGRDLLSRMMVGARNSLRGGLGVRLLGRRGGPGLGVGVGLSGPVV